MKYTEAELKQIFKTKKIEILERCGGGAESNVYKVKYQNQLLALKVPSSNLSSLKEILKNYTREAIYIQRINHPSFPKVGEVSVVQDIPYILTEFVDGSPLSKNLQKGALEHNEFFHIFLSIFDAINALHSCNLVHKDIKPENIMITKGGDVKLIDFGFSSRVTSGIRKIDHKVGTLLYSSPEQTGMIDRSVDARSDLYSLGIVMYQCLTGSAPFVSNNAGELLRMHTSSVAKSPFEVNPKINKYLSDLVMILLRKDKDERYQSAAGVLKDLIKIENESSFDEFENSILLKKIIRDEVNVGRDDELKAIDNCWQKVKEGSGKILNITGESGTGKTKLARDFLDRIQDSNVLILTAKSSQKGEVPFSLFAHSFDGFINNAKKFKKNDQLDYFIKCGKKYSIVLKTLSPVLKEIFTISDDEITGDAQELYFNALADFIIDLSKSSFKVVVHFDNLQWIDSGSGQVLERISQKIENCNLMILCTQRNSVMSVCEKLVGCTDSTLTLNPFSEDQILDMIAKYLNTDIEKIDNNLSNYIHKFSKGNPFASMELIKQLVFEEQFIFPSWGNWEFKNNDLNGIKFGSSFIDFLCNRLSNLNEQTIKYLKLGAVFGHQFPIEVLVHIFKTEMSLIENDLMQALEKGVLEGVGNHSYAFIHDKIQEALLQMISDEELKFYNQQLADLFLEDSTLMDKYPYHIARFLWDGNWQLHPQKAFESIVNTAEFAFRKFSFDEAIANYEKALLIQINENVISKTLIETKLADSYAGKHDINKALLYYEKALKVEKDSLKRAKIHAKVVRMFTSNLQIESCWKHLELAYKELEVNPPWKSNWHKALCIWDYFVGSLIGITGIGFGTAKGKKRERFHIEAMLLEDAAHVVYYDLKISLLVLIALKAIRFTNRLGPSLELVHSYCSIAFVLGAMKKYSKRDKYLEKSFKYSKVINNPIALAHTESYVALNNLMEGDLPVIEKSLLNVLNNHGQWLEAEMWFGIASLLSSNYSDRGYLGKAISIGDLVDRKVSGTDRQAAIVGNNFRFFTAQNRLKVLAMSGKMVEFSRYYEIAKESQHQSVFIKICYYAAIMASYSIFEDFGEEFQNAKNKLNQLTIEPRWVPTMLKPRYLTKVLCMINEAMQVKNRELKKVLIKDIEENMKYIEDMDLNRYQVLLNEQILASYFALVEKYEKSLKIIDANYMETFRMDAPIVTFEFLMLQSICYSELGNNASAENSRALAAGLAFEQGWEILYRKAKNLSINDKAISANRKEDDHSILGANSSSFQFSNNHLMENRFEALLKLSLLNTNLSDIHETSIFILDQSIEIFGADRAFLFLADQSGRLSTEIGRNDKKLDISGLKGFSQSMVDKVYSSGIAEVMNVTNEGELSVSESIVAQGLKSIMVTPFYSNNKIMGIIYLDSKIAKGFFTNNDLRILLALVNNLAATIEANKAYKLEMESREFEAESKALKEYQEKMATLVSNVPIILFSIDSNKELIMFEGDSENILISELQRAQSTYVESFCNYPDLVKAIDKCFDGNDEVVNISVNNKFLEVYLKASKSEKNNQVEVLGVTIDVTDRVKALERLDSSARLASLGEMAGGIAHEINNPLAILSGYTTLLQVKTMKMEMSEEQKQPIFELIDKVEKTHVRIHKIVSGLLSLSRRSGVSERAEVEVLKLVKSVIDICHEKFRLQEIEVEMIQNHDEEKLFCNDSQIIQVLLDLLNTSFDTLKGFEGKRKITINIYNKGESTIIEIADSGPGINEDLRERIFEPYFTVKSLGGNSVIGLSVSKDIIENHNGTLKLMSTENDRTKFVLSLPTLVQSHKQAS